MSSDDALIASFFRDLSIEDAREHLNTYTVEEVRRLWEAGVFGDSPVSNGIKTYITERIVSGDRLE